MTGPERAFIAWPHINGAGLAFKTDNGHRHEYIRADLYAAPAAEIARLTAERDAALAVAAKVKPLVWEEAARSYPMFHARSLGLVYEVSCDPDMGWAWAQGDGLVDFAEAETEEIAKAAAQADYEARILAALQPDPDARQADLSDAARDVLSERARQISVEGWTPDHDDAHSMGEMAGAAACYAMQVALDHIGRDDLHKSVSRMIIELWPWASYWWKPTGRRRDLVKAAALCIAEIERQDRATPPADLAAKIGGAK